MSDIQEPCDSRACARLCVVEVAVGVLMAVHILDADQARTELAHLATLEHTSRHRIARRLLAMPPTPGVRPADPGK